MVKAIVTGAAGRMGGRIINNIQNVEGIELSGALERKGHIVLGKDAGMFSGIGFIGVTISSELELIIDSADVVIDFTTAESSLENLKVVSDAGKAIVIGSTRFSKAQTDEVRNYAKKVPCVFSANMSVGVNVMLKVLRDTAGILGDEYDAEIVEAHHRLKRDAPSGTALMLGRAVAEGFGRDLDEVGVYERHGLIGVRTKKEIGIQTLRGGDIVGDHTVIFAGPGERLEFIHRAHTMDNFAVGAVKAGLYDMQDVLGLK